MFLIFLAALQSGETDTWGEFEREMQFHIETACSDDEAACLPPLQRTLAKAMANLRSIEVRSGLSAAKQVQADCQRRSQINGATATSKYVECMATATAPAGSTQVSFEFKGLRPGAHVNASSVQLSKCDAREPSGRQVCTMSRGETVAGAPIMIGLIYANKNAFYQMGLSFHRDHFPTVLQAFAEKYGQPCRRESRQAQNRIGSTFENPTVVWCFKEGEMTLSYIGVSLDYSNISFIAPAFTPSAPALPRDF